MGEASKVNTGCSLSLSLSLYLSLSLSLSLSLFFIPHLSSPYSSSLCIPLTMSDDIGCARRKAPLRSQAFATAHSDTRPSPASDGRFRGGVCCLPLRGLLEPIGTDPKPPQHFPSEPAWDPACPLQIRGRETRPVYRPSRGRLSHPAAVLRSTVNTCPPALPALHSAHSSTRSKPRPDPNSPALSRPNVPWRRSPGALRSQVHRVRRRLVKPASRRRRRRRRHRVALLVS